MDPQTHRLFRHEATRLGVSVGEAELALFDRYVQQLILWGRRHNLVSCRDPQEIYTIHLLDSLTPIPFVPTTTRTIIDLGAGQGFPGIPMKIVRKNWEVTLVESVRKKVSFLKDTIRILALEGIKVIHGRVEELVQEDHLRESFDGVVSRATFKLPKLIIFAETFVRPGGWVVAMKGEVPDREREEMRKVIENTKLIHIETLRVLSSASRGPKNLYLFKKSF
ncbi:MAG: 16S rRNA (guanine(527)-N(7))-methyltransferase RsmG [Syntrophales bacterium]|nr:16S rRNA (guanine(527)-N(7))-methyltransferase RsmG [Syntrophales bacterium]